MNGFNGVVCLLTRKNKSEFLWVKRPSENAFMGGYFAFIGGGIEDSDENLAFTITRELFEELGILVSTSGIVQTEGFTERENVKTKGGFRELMNAKDLEIDPDLFRQITDWRSGEEYSRATNIRLFELEVDETLLNDPMTYIDDEATFAEWITIEDATAILDGGNAVASALVRALLVNFAKKKFRFQQAEVLEELSTYKINEGIFSIAMQSHTLPPSTTTNCVIVIDDSGEDFLVIDPGGAKKVEQERLLKFIQELITSGLRFLGIALTHHHHDHHAALPFLLNALGCPIFGHEKLAQRTEYKVNPITNNFMNGLRVIETPGHCDDHLAFYLRRTKTIIAGDMVASKGSILIEPEHGHVGQYLDSLERLLGLNANCAIPSHGSVLTHPSRHFGEYILHRLERHKEVSKLIYEKEHARPIDLVPEIYKDLSSDYYPLAALSVQSHLLWMCESGEVRRSENDGDMFHLVQT